VTVGDLDLPGIISCIAGAATKDDALEAMLSLTRPLGADYVLAGIVYSDRMNEPQTLAAEWPTEWYQRYHKDRLVEIDPVAAAIPRFTLPFSWQDLEKSKESRRFFSVAAEHGLNQGVMVPIFGPGLIGGVSCSGRKIDDNPKSLALLHLGAIYLHARLSMDQPLPGFTLERPFLSPRQIEVIRLAAKGHSYWEMGQIMGIGERTVRFHMTEMMRKFDTRTRVQTVLKAVSIGIVRLS
jgi:DNA-binding CsgD family transcriptional regulator